MSWQLTTAAASSGIALAGCVETAPPAATRAARARYRVFILVSSLVTFFRRSRSRVCSSRDRRPKRGDTALLAPQFRTERALDSRLAPTFARSLRRSGVLALPL